MRGMRKFLKPLIEAAAVALALAVYGAPFLFVIVNAGKSEVDAADMNLKIPKAWHYLANFAEIFATNDHMVVRAFFNSALITAASVAVLVVVAAMAGMVLQRRSSRGSSIIGFLFMMGLMIPPSVVTTIWVLRNTHLYRTLTGMVLIEIALTIPFAVLLYRSFMVSIPREIDEASIIDGCGVWAFFFRIVFPLLKPVTMTIAILQGVNIFNDFVNPLYFLPGAENVTIQLTLYNFMGQYATSWNLLFANILIISIPPLAFFIIFNRKIVEGMVAGAVKG